MGRRGFIPPFRAGVTLTELLIVMTIMAILAGMAVPTYNRTRERSLRRAARDVMLAIYAGEQVFRSQASPASYREIPDLLDTIADWNAIFMDRPNVDPPDQGVLPVDFRVDPGAPGISTSFTAVGVRLGGPCDTTVITIDQNRTIAGSWLACF